MLTTNRNFGAAAAGALLVLGGFSLAQRTALAEDQQGKCTVRVELKAGGIPVLSQLPYVGKLFINSCSEANCEVGKCEAVKQVVKQEATRCQAGECQSGAASRESAEHLGVDFDFVPQEWVCSHGGVVGCCVQCAADEKLSCAEKSGAAIARPWPVEFKTCDAGCTLRLAAGCVSGCPMAHASSGVTAASCQQAACQQPCCERDSDNAEIAALTADNAALQAALEVREEMLEQQMELIEKVATLLSENAKLKAQLHFQEQLAAERSKNEHGRHELACENNRLRAEVALAEQRQVAVEERLEMARENERLKLRLAAIEERSAANGERISKKPVAKKKVR
jgi:hypothetical protein